MLVYLGPITLSASVISLLIWFHSSNQNDVVAPLLTFTRIKDWAKDRYFSNFFHIQEPTTLLSFAFHIDPFLIRYLWTHLNQSEDLAYKILQISFKQQTVFASSSDFNPSPPSPFNLQTSSQHTLGLFGFKAGPDHKKLSTTCQSLWYTFLEF